jgi:hypothetical protein
MHAHIQGNERAWLPLYIANGVTGIRDMGADLEFILDVRDATASGRTLGPRIVAAGPMLDDAPAEWPLRMRVKNADESRAAVQLLKRRGVDGGSRVARRKSARRDRERTAYSERGFRGTTPTQECARSVARAGEGCRAAVAIQSWNARCHQQEHRA